MKSKIYRIMGVALALVLVFILGAAFMPVNTPGGPDTAEAGTLSWSTITIPTGTGSTLVGGAEDLGPVAISPNYGTDNTVWASVTDFATPATPVVYKSTNGGHTWTATTTALGAAGDLVVELKASPNYANDDSVFVVTQTPGGNATTGRVYRSTNGGSSFGQLGVVTLAAGEVITCFDVAPDYNGTGTLVVGTADVATNVVPAAAATCVQIWGANDVLSWTGLATGLATPADVTAITYSPNYTMDSTILTVSSDNAGTMASIDPYLRAIVGGVWDSGIAATCVNGAAPGALGDYSDSTNRVNGDVWAADVAVPQDYNGQVSTTRRAYVSIATNASGATTGNVYRITNVTAGTALATAAAIQLFPIEYRGDFAEGTLLGGLWGNAAATASDVYRTTNPTSSVVNWYGVSGGANMPTGTCGGGANTTAYIAASMDYVNDTTVVVGTQGDGSAFGGSTDGAVSFNEYGLIDNDNLGAGAGGEQALGTLSDLALSPGYADDGLLYLVTENDDASANDTNVWMRNDTGLWDRCYAANFATAGTGVIATSNAFATDSVLYVGNVGGTNIWYSANAGQSWSARAVAAGLGVTIQTIAAPDATTVYVGDSAGNANIAKSTNSGWTWPTALMKNSGGTAPVMSLKAKDSTILVGGSAGSVRRSDDGGSTWTKVSATLGGGVDVYVAFDGTTVWAADGGTGNVWRSEAAGGWQQIAAATTGNDATELILSPDETMYLSGAGTLDDVIRSINPDAALPTPNVTFQSMATPGVGATAVNVMDVVSGGSNIVAIIDGGPVVRMYTDTLSRGTDGPTLSSPADGSTLTRAQGTRFTIAAHLTNVTNYRVDWSPDSTFTSNVNTVAGGIAAPSLQTAAVNVTEGVTIYWRARASAPLNSPWSETWSLESQITTAVQAPIPQYPAGDDVMDVPLKPVFNWGAFKYANGYEFQLANDSGMTDLLVDMSGADALGNTTSYVLTSALDYDSTYYWRVRAIKGSATAYSDWSAITGFTTMAEPVEEAPPEPIVIPPTAPAPEATPAYIWAIIAIGAVLVIVVIVLIVRTRRAA